MLQFSQPWFLLGAATAAVPFVLHLMRREVVRNLVFPSIRFILKGQVPQGGRRRLRDLLLLILRMAALILLSLLLAAPFRVLPNSPTAKVEKQNILLVDLSASMSAQGKLTQAGELLAELTADMPDQNWIMIRSANGLVGAPEPAKNRKELLAKVADLSAGTAGGNHQEALRKAVTLLGEKPGGNLHIVSDFQAGDWLAEQLPTLPPGSSLALHPVSMGTRNLGITSARFRKPANQTGSLLVEVRNYGTSEEAFRLDITAGASAKAADGKVAPGKTLKMLVAIAETTSSIGKISLGDDEYAGDNDYHLWLGEPAPRQLLAVYDTRQPGAAATELFFLDKALSVKAESMAIPFQIQHADSETFFALNLDQVDGLLLLGAMRNLDAAGIAKIQQFLAAGGTVMCTPAEENPGRQLIELRKHQLLTAEYQGMLDGRPGTGGTLAIDSVNDTTGLGKLFAEMDHSDIYLFPIRRMLNLTTHPPAVDILRTRDGKPLLARQQTGNGTFYFFSMPLTTTWSDLPVSMSFLPMVHEIFAQRPASGDEGILRLDCGEGIPSRTTLSGERLPRSRGAEQDTAAGLPGSNQKDGSPRSGKETAGEEAELPDNPAWANRAFDTPPRAGKIDTLPVEINVSRKESPLTTRPLTAIRAAMTGETDSRPESEAAAPQVRRQDLRPHTALLLLLFVVADATLAATRDRRENRR